MAPRYLVDRALHDAEINRDLLRSGPSFIPYMVEARLVESLARSLGERSLGALVGQRFDYNGFQGFAKYVLAAPDLAGALVRSRRAIPFIHPGAEFGLRLDGDNLIFHYRSGLETAVGHHHLSEGAIFLIAHVFRHYLGQEWRPEWIEMSISGRREEARLQDLTGIEVRGGAEILGMCVSIDDLVATNPTLPDASDLVTLSDLPVHMGVRPPKTMTDKVFEVMRLQLALGDLSEESVAHRLSIGTRTLQRALQAEGISFREIRSRFVEDRARALLTESDLGIDEIALSLGYSEPNSFRRAFRQWTSRTPNQFRKSSKKQSSAT